MRGSSLAHASVVEALKPFIVVAWNGRRPQDMPDDIREVYNAVGPRKPTSNIVFFVLEALGKLYSWFSAAHPPDLGFDPDRQGQYMKEQIDYYCEKLNLPSIKITPKLTLPDLPAGERGVRVILSFAENKMQHYRAPVVETKAWTRSEQQALRYPESARDVPAQALQRWLGEIYPAAIMDGPGGVESIAGTLTLKPAGSDGSWRYATLIGEVRFVLNHEMRTSYKGNLEMVLFYRADSADFVRVRGAFQGVFPKPDKFNRNPMRIPMTAAIESRPE